MPTLQRSALVDYPAELMFDLVNDIEQYPRFLAGCEAARVLSRSDEELVGELTLAKAGIRQRFTTRNSLSRPEAIDMQLVEGNFSRFAAGWRFDALSDSACKISFSIDFEFNSGLMDFAAQKLFSAVADKLVDAIVARARTVYD